MEIRMYKDKHRKLNRKEYNRYKILKEHICQGLIVNDKKRLANKSKWIWKWWSLRMRDYKIKDICRVWEIKWSYWNCMWAS